MKSNQLQIDTLSEEDIFGIPSVQSALQKATATLEEKLNATQNEISSVKAVRYNFDGESEKLLANTVSQDASCSVLDVGQCTRISQLHYALMDFRDMFPAHSIIYLSKLTS